MAETRSQTMIKEAASRGVEEILGSRIYHMLERTQQLEITVADQNEKMDKNITYMFEAIRLIPGSRNQPSTSHDNNIGRSSPGVSNTPIINANANDQARGRAGTQYKYAGLTRMAKLDFSQFSGERMKEWLSKVE